MISILIVDDDEQIRSLYKQILMMRGYLCHTAEDGLAALEFLKNNELPDLLITDIMMPRMNGIELIKTVKVEYPNIRVLAISGNTNKMSDFIAAVKGGASLILQKPVCVKELMDSIKQYGL